MENYQVLQRLDKVKLQINGLTHAGEGVGRYGRICSRHSARGYGFR